MPAIQPIPAPAVQELKVTREPVNLKDLETSYITLGIQEFQELTIQKIDKICDGPAEFNLSGTNYKLEVMTTEGKILSINAWVLWNALRNVLKGKEKIEGVKVRIDHTGKGLYSVTLI